MDTRVMTEAGKRTTRTVARVAVRVGKRVKAVADRHQGVLVGTSVGFMLGRCVERVPGVQILGTLPRYVGATAGACIGYVFEKAVQEVLTEERLQRRALTSPVGPRARCP